VQESADAKRHPWIIALTAHFSYPEADFLLWSRSVQQDIFTSSGEDVSPDSQERIEDFFSRHGGAGSLPSRRGWNEQGDCGWFEVYAADGYKLRCDWSRFGSREQMKFSEESPCARQPQQH
jgi:hypothetical protein